MKDKKNIKDFENAMAGQNIDILEKLQKAQEEKLKNAQEKGLEEGQKQKLEEHKKRLKNRTIMNEKFLEKLVEYQRITKETAQEIEQIIKNDSFLHKAYTTDRLFISTATRIGVETILSSYEQESRDDIKKNNKLTKEKKEEEISDLARILHEVRFKVRN
ncbi:hypothetical protein [Rickettsia endosymbiont of Polydrusus tereticollis]|uniref:hypothetical protein n=1 Tax=Rickettsia endosymbiont of Polydrusus tereticollis TaxID=3066251 RepID=UPI0031331152